MANSFETEWETLEYETLSSLAENLVFRLPGCTDVMIRKTIASVYRDFCKRTCCFTTRQKITLENGVREYPLYAIISDCIVDCVVGVKVHDVPLDKEMYFFRSEAMFVSDRELPDEGCAAEMEVECVEIPKVGCEHAPSAFIQRYGDAIESGVMAKLCMMSGRAWSDANVAAQEIRAYENALTSARARQIGGGNLSSGGLNYLGGGYLV